ncbi:MAG: hypothetical protein HQL63_06365 [Magnetococcales bacterium]|nr:hypothetical protein [Magnetococcales bacterium]
MDKNTRNQAALPTPMIDDIKSRSFGTFGVDGAVFDLLKEMAFLGIFSRHGWSKRSGKDLPVLIVLLIIHPLLKVRSVVSPGWWKFGSGITPTPRHLIMLPDPSPDL